jgi:putative oxidoreductase
MQNKSLIVAGGLSCLAALLHLAIIIGGPDWYRFFGAGEQFAFLAEQGSFIPALTALCISIILFFWGAYAFSGAGLIRRLPFLKTCLVLITLVYLIRGIGGIILSVYLKSSPLMGDQFGFMMWSSVICVVYGAFYLLGIKSGWASFTYSSSY